MAGERIKPQFRIDVPEGHDNSLAGSGIPVNSRLILYLDRVPTTDIERLQAVEHVLVVARAILRVPGTNVLAKRIDQAEACCILEQMKRGELVAGDSTEAGDME